MTLLLVIAISPVILPTLFCHCEVAFGRPWQSRCPLSPVIPPKGGIQSNFKWLRFLVMGQRSRVSDRVRTGVQVPNPALQRLHTVIKGTDLRLGPRMGHPPPHPRSDSDGARQGVTHTIS